MMECNNEKEFYRLRNELNDKVELYRKLNTIEKIYIDAFSKDIRQEKYLKFCIDIGDIYLELIKFVLKDKVLSKKMFLLSIITHYRLDDNGEIFMYVESVNKKIYIQKIKYHEFNKFMCEIYYKYFGI